MSNLRVVSLVPSATESLVALGVTPVACTRFCEQSGIPTVGGTKDPDLAAIIELGPELVVMNDEENRREDADALTGAGLTVHSMSPRSVAQVASAVTALASALGVSVPRFDLPDARSHRGSAVAIIWRRPWMVQAGETYGSAVLEHLGWSNPFATAPDRYPTIDLAAIAAVLPDLVVLPSEPYPFSPRHVPGITEVVARARVVLIDGRDLFWWGTRTPAALDRLAAALEGGPTDPGTGPVEGPPEAP